MATTKVSDGMLLNGQQWWHSVKSYGAVGNGTADDTSAVQAAINASSATDTVVFSRGAYLIAGSLNAFGKSLTFEFMGGASSPDYSKFPGTVVLRSSGETKYRGPHFLSSGGCSGGGLSIGGTGYRGDYGMRLGLDGNPAWMTVTCGKPSSNTECTFQPNSYNGVVNTNGTAVTWVSGSQFVGFSGTRIYINNTPYLIASVVSPTSLTLTSSAGVQSGVAYQQVALVSNAVVNVASGVVSVVSGELFAYWWVGEQVTINGTAYTVATVSGDGTTLTVTTSIPNATGVALVKEDLNARDCAAIGINKQSGTSEERLVFAAKAIGEYHIASVATGTGQHYPIITSCGGVPITTHSPDGSFNVYPPSGDDAVLRISSMNTPTTGRAYTHVVKPNGEYAIYAEVEAKDLILVAPTSSHIRAMMPFSPPYTLKANLLPAATYVGGLVFVPDEAGGAVIAFSDGANWRRVTDRAIVS